jgi:hypothetical protein
MAIRVPVFISTKTDGSVLPLLHERAAPYQRRTPSFCKVCAVHGDIYNENLRKCEWERNSGTKCNGAKPTWGIRLYYPAWR